MISWTPMFSLNTKKCIVMSSCVGMILLDVILMVASNAENAENKNMDVKLVEHLKLRQYQTQIFNF